MVRLMGSTPIHSLECLTLYVCVSCFICAFANINSCAQVYFVKPLECVSVVWAFLANMHCAKHVTQATATTDPPVYCTEKWHIPLLYSILVSPLTFMRKCDVVWFRLLLGLFNIVFLWGQTNSTPWEAFLSSLSCSALSVSLGWSVQQGRVTFLGCLLHMVHIPAGLPRGPPLLTAGPAETSPKAECATALLQPKIILTQL